MPYAAGEARVWCKRDKQKQGDGVYRLVRIGELTAREVARRECDVSGLIKSSNGRLPRRGALA